LEAVGAAGGEVHQKAGFGQALLEVGTGPGLVADDEYPHGGIHEKRTEAVG
jgi:hypothetical protein